MWPFLFAWFKSTEELILLKLFTSAVKKLHSLHSSSKLYDESHLVRSLLYSLQLCSSVLINQSVNQSLINTEWITVEIISFHQFHVFAECEAHLSSLFDTLISKWLVISRLIIKAALTLLQFRSTSVTFSTFFSYEKFPRSKVKVCILLSVFDTVD